MTDELAWYHHNDNLISLGFLFAALAQQLQLM
jgi:hypothetical protein